MFSQEGEIGHVQAVLRFATDLRFAEYRCTAALMTATRGVTSHSR